MDPRLLAAAFWLFLLTTGCAHQQPQPILVSSGNAEGYALGYAELLSAETTELVDDKLKTTELAQKLETLKGGLKIDVDPQLLLLIVRQADEAGRSEAFANANEEDRRLRQFWDEERGRIAGRVSAAAQKQLTETSCTQVDVSGAIGPALKDGVDRQLEKRLRAENEAQRTIEQKKGTIGAANVNALQKLADEIALTSYLANVALVLDGRRIDRLLAERSDVESTLEDAIERERKVQAGRPSPAEQKASQERVVEYEKSRAAIPPAATSAEAARKDLDAVIESTRKQYQSSLDALEKQLEAQAAQAKG